MDWQADYARKRVTAAAALEVVKSGDRVVFAHACGEPLDLVDALVARAPELRHVEIVHMVAMGKGEYCKPEYAESFFHNSLFTGASSREAVREGRGDYTPVFFHEIPGLFLDGYLPVDVALVHLSPPDKHGWCSFGVSVDYTKAAASVAAVRRSRRSTRTCRAPTATRSSTSPRSTTWSRSEQPIIELPPPRIGPVEEAIGKNIARLVDDGACLQLGIGGIPDAVLLFLHEKNDLGIHTEMFSDGVVDLSTRASSPTRARRCTADKIVANFLMGTRRLYDFVDDNPAVNMFPVSYVNDPYVIGQNDGVVAINSAIEVDIMGQVVADSMGAGAVHRHRRPGRFRARRGAQQGRQGDHRACPRRPRRERSHASSPKIADGAAVTTMRADVDYVVTEHGVAHLKGRRLRERAEALIEIADPAFKDELIAGVKELRGEGWLRRREESLARPSAG